MKDGYDDIMKLATDALRAEHNFRAAAGGGNCPTFTTGHCTCVAKPLWWDEHGCPRWASHHPRHCPDIYANEVALVEIACQRCLTRQLVQMSWSTKDTLHVMIRREWAERHKRKATPSDRREWSLADSVKDGTIHYGDPPFHNHDRGEFCHAGCTMNCYDLRVVEFWRRGVGVDLDWIRMTDLERELPDFEELRKDGAIS